MEDCNGGLVFTPTTPLVQPMDPTTPLVQPMDPTTPLVQPMDPTTPLVQPMDPTTPLVQPMDPTTPLVQPMDISIHRPFKQAMRGEVWVTWFSKHTSRTIHGNLTQPTRQDAIDWVSAAWNSIKSETIVESFKCCGITASVDGSDDTKMFRRVPHVIIESEDESEVGDDDSDGMVTGDDFEGFDADDDLFEII